MKFLCKLLRVKNESKVERRRRQAKKISVVWRPFEPINKECKKRGRSGCLFKKSKSPSFCFPSSSSQYIFTRIYIRTRKKTKTKTKALSGTSARGGDAPSHPTAPGLLSRVFRESTRGRERERKSARRFKINLRKKKEEKRGVTKRRVEVRILASLAHHE